jgi:oxygen-dependent protoporphyrinogen oxidase
LPAYRAADLVAPFADDLAGQLRQIEYASSAIVVSGHRLADIRHPLDAFGLVIPAIERRKILAVSFTSRKFPDRAPEGCVQLRTFVGGAMQPEMFELSDDEILQTVRDELRELLGVEGEPDFAIVARYPRAMPQYHVGHLERVAAIEAAAARLPGLALAGNAYHGVGVPDCVQSAEAAAQRLYAARGALHGVMIEPGSVDCS